ncbi:hypothetical protein Dimus_019866 [Dionaea muscipula]
MSELVVDGELKKKESAKVFEKISEVRNELTESVIKGIKVLFPSSDVISYQSLLPTESAIELQTENAIAIQYDHFVHELRFPFHPFLLQVFNAHSVILAQLAANSTALVIGFMIMLKKVGVEPNLRLFNEVLYLRELSGSDGYYVFATNPGYRVL